MRLASGSGLKFQATAYRPLAHHTVPLRCFWLGRKTASVCLCHRYQRSVLPAVRPVLRRFPLHCVEESSIQHLIPIDINRHALRDPGDGFLTIQFFTMGRSRGLRLYSLSFRSSPDDIADSLYETLPKESPLRGPHANPHQQLLDILYFLPGILGGTAVAWKRSSRPCTAQGSRSAHTLPQAIRILWRQRQQLRPCGPLSKEA